MNYYPAYICENGHERSTLSHTCADKYCTTCGAPIISRCPMCGKTLRGRPSNGYGYVIEFVVPAYCPDCGKPFPWTIAAIESTMYMLEASDLSEKEQRELIDVLPDAVSQTPKTSLAAVRFRKAMTSAGSFVADGLRQFVIDFGCSLLKSQLGLD